MKKNLLTITLLTSFSVISTYAQNENDFKTPEKSDDNAIQQVHMPKANRVNRAVEEMTPRRLFQEHPNPDLGHYAPARNQRERVERSPKNSKKRKLFSNKRS